MNQCGPSWDLEENSALPGLKFHAYSNSFCNSLPLHVPSLDYEVAELKWENGQLAMHGLGPPREVDKPLDSSSPASKYSTWDKPAAGGTLESVVNQATMSAVDGGGYNDTEPVPWFDYHRAMANPVAGTGIAVTKDALVPCTNNTSKCKNHENSTHVPGIGTCVGSCSGATTASLDCDSRRIALDTCEREASGVAGFGSTSLVSAENTISGKECTNTSGDERDSVSHSRSQRETATKEDVKKGSEKSSVSTKRSRAAAIHNQSERKRRDRINERMKTLQKLVPNSSKTDKASMLDEVIEYLKQLQAQVQMMSRMSMMLPLAMQQQQQLQMSMMAPMGMGMGMGMGVMDMNAINRAARMLPLMPPFAPLPSWDNPRDRLPMPDPMSASIACQAQPMNMDAYSRLAALYQQFQHSCGSGSKN